MSEFYFGSGTAPASEVVGRPLARPVSGADLGGRMFRTGEVLTSDAETTTARIAMEATMPRETTFATALIDGGQPLAPGDGVLVEVEHPWSEPHGYTILRARFCRQPYVINGELAGGPPVYQDGSNAVVTLT